MVKYIFSYLRDVEITELHEISLEGIPIEVNDSTHTRNLLFVVHKNDYNNSL